MVVTFGVEGRDCLLLGLRVGPMGSVQKLVLKGRLLVRVQSPVPDLGTRVRFLSLSRLLIPTVAGRVGLYMLIDGERGILQHWAHSDAGAYIELAASAAPTPSTLKPCL